LLDARDPDQLDQLLFLEARDVLDVLLNRPAKLVVVLLNGGKPGTSLSLSTVDAPPALVGRSHPNMALSIRRAARSSGIRNFQVCASRVDFAFDGVGQLTRVALPRSPV